MEFQIVSAAAGAEIRMVGRLTYDDHGKFHDIKALVEDSKAKAVVLDLSGLDFIDSAGLGMLVVLEDAARTVNVGITIRGAHGTVRKLMNLVNFGTVIRLVD